MFIYKSIGRVQFAFGDSMQGKTEQVFPKIQQLAEMLGLPQEVRKKLTISNWVSEFRECGATQRNFRNWVHEQPGTEKLAVPNSGAQIVLIAQDTNGDYCTMVQFRKNFEIGFPGGASNIWCYNGKEEWEDVLLTAYREFKEETGMDFEGDLVFLDFTTTTNHYEGYPDTYAPSMYYGSEVSYKDLMRYATGLSDEGTHAIVRIKDLNDYRWFNNAAQIFKLLQELYLEELYLDGLYE